MTTLRLKKLSHPAQATSEGLDRIDQESKLIEVKPIILLHSVFHRKQLNPIKKVRFKCQMRRRHRI